MDSGQRLFIWVFSENKKGSGEKLARGIVKFAWPWNAEFASEIVSTDSPEAGQPIDIADGLTIRLLSPGDDQLVELLSKWDSALSGANIRTFDPDVDPANGMLVIDV